MSELGWYYLHTNGDVIHKRGLPGTAADIRESDLAVALWPIDTADRSSAWRILVEAMAAGALRTRVLELAELWACDDEDAHNYAENLGIRLYMDGSQWCATRADFVDLQESPAGFGGLALEAMASLAKELGYLPTKMWGPSFADLVNR